MHFLRFALFCSTLCTGFSTNRRDYKSFPLKRNKKPRASFYLFLFLFFPISVLLMIKYYRDPKRQRAGFGVVIHGVLMCCNPPPKKVKRTTKSCGFCVLCHFLSRFLLLTGHDRFFIFLFNCICCYATPFTFVKQI